MRQVVKVCLITSAIVLVTASAAFAQKGALPKGRPFQILQDAILAVEANVDASIVNLQTQLTALTGRVEAVEQRNAVQDQLIGVLQGAALSLQQRMTSAEFSITNLTQWNQLQATLLAQLGQRVTQLEATAASHGNALTQLLNLYNAQQTHLNAVQNNLNFLNALSANLQIQVGSLQSQLTINNTLDQTQQAQLSSLITVQGQVAGHINGLTDSLTALNAAYLQTRGQLATGCPPGQSIRQIIANAPAVCEIDSGQHTTSTTASATNTVGPLSFGSAVATCPPAPDGQPGFLATGGGHSMALTSFALNVVASVPFGPASWLVTVFNPTVNPAPQSFGATANCVRQVIP